MSDYIERGALIAFLDENHNENDWMVNQYNADWICSWIDSQPTADVVEVKHGRWNLNKDGSGTCNRCHRTQGEVWDMDTWQNFCGHCGADMRDGGKVE